MNMLAKDISKYCDCHCNNLIKNNVRQRDIAQRKNTAGHTQIYSVSNVVILRYITQVLLLRLQQNVFTKFYFTADSDLQAKR